MKTKLLAKFTCILLIFSWVKFVGYGVAAEFVPDSANITNRYAGLDGKEGRVSLGCSESQYQGQVFYTDIINQEKVDGVNCLKTNVLSQNELITIWFAQDTDGTVWALKVFVHSSNQIFTLGNGIISPFMPANPVVGDRAGLTVPESDQYYCRIVETNVNVPQTCWGIGPIEGFNDCIKIECGAPDTINEEEYFCADFGQVEYSRTSGWGHHLKEIIEETCPSDLDGDGVTDGIDLFIFSSGFGKTCP